MTQREILRQTRAHLLYLRELGVEQMEEPRRSSGGKEPVPGPSTSPRADSAERSVQRRAGDQEPASRPDGAGEKSLEGLRESLGDCRRCRLSGGRTQIIFGTGNPKADLMFVGEAPGEDEDLQGKPFVGKAGQLLTKMIEAMGLTRDSVYIANVIKCRPPGNRNPEEDEIAACKPFLMEQIRVIRPVVVCALGRFAAQTLLKTGVPISQLRGKISPLPVLPEDPAAGVKVIPTFHPAYLLRNPSAKKPAWEDLQGIMKELGFP